MWELREGGYRPKRWTFSRRALALVALGIAVDSTPSAGQVDAGSAVGNIASQQAEAFRPTGSFLRKTVPFEAEYLTRVAEMAVERARVFIAEREARRNSPAEEYARRYGISRELAQRIIDVAETEGIDPELGFRLVRVESVFDPRARNAGALGLTQLMPATARSLDRTATSESRILDPQTNLTLGFRYLRQMIVRYKGDVRLGLLAYNRGETAVDRALRSGRDPENGYSPKVLGTGSANPYRGSGILNDE